MEDLEAIWDRGDFASTWLEPCARPSTSGSTTAERLNLSPSRRVRTILMATRTTTFCCRFLSGSAATRLAYPLECCRRGPTCLTSGEQEL